MKNPNSDVRTGKLDAVWRCLTTAHRPTAPMGVLAISLLISRPAPAALVGFDISDQSVTSGDSFNLPVTISGFNDVSGAQFSLAWDAGVIQFVSVTPNSDMGSFFTFNQTQAVTDGKLGFAWEPASAGPETYADGTPIFSIQFTAIGAAGSQSAVSFTDDLIARYVSVNLEEPNVFDFSGSLPGTITVVPEPVNCALTVFACAFTASLAARRWRTESIREGKRRAWHRIWQREAERCRQLCPASGKWPC